MWRWCLADPRGPQCPHPRHLRDTPGPNRPSPASLRTTPSRTPSAVRYNNRASLVDQHHRLLHGISVWRKVIRWVINKKKSVILSQSIWSPYSVIILLGKIFIASSVYVHKRLLLIYSFWRGLLTLKINHSWFDDISPESRIFKYRMKQCGSIISHFKFASQSFWEMVDSLSVCVSIKIEYLLVIMRHNFGKWIFEQFNVSRNLNEGGLIRILCHSCVANSYNNNYNSVGYSKHLGTTKQCER